MTSGLARHISTLTFCMQQQLLSIPTSRDDVSISCSNRSTLSSSSWQQTTRLTVDFLSSRLQKNSLSCSQQSDSKNRIETQVHRKHLEAKVLHPMHPSSSLRTHAQIPVLLNSSMPNQPSMHPRAAFHAKSGRRAILSFPAMSRAPSSIARHDRYSVTPSFCISRLPPV